MAEWSVRKYLSIASTFAVALGIGFAMQNGDALAARFGAQDVDSPNLEPDARRGLQITSMAPGFSPTGGIVVRSDIDTPLAVPAAAGPTDITLPATDEVATPRAMPALPDAPWLDSAKGKVLDAVTSTADCAAELQASLAPGAMVDLTLTARCAPRSVAVIHHRGMMVSLLTDAGGNASLSIPALAVEAVFMAEVDSLSPAIAVVEVPDVTRFDRSVVQWQGEVGLSLHAREDGAGYGSHGHVTADSARTVATALSGFGGYISELGDRQIPLGYRAHVYSHRAGSGRVDLEVEAAVLPETCGQTLSLQTIQVAPNAPVLARDISLTMPDCSGIGEYLVLSNLVRDLTLALR